MTEDSPTMTHRRSPFLAALIFLAAVALARADLEFIGVLATPQKISFALADAAGKGTTWRDLGQVFQGYTLKSYDRASDTLTLVKNGAELRLILKPDAKIQTARLELAGAIKLGSGEKLEVVRATLRYDEENVFPLKDGLVYRVKPKLQPDGTIVFEVVVERPAADGTAERLAAPKVLVLPNREFHLQVGDIAFGFTPRSS